jgi:hypothetical protein
MAYAERLELFDGVLVPLRRPIRCYLTIFWPCLHLIRYLCGRARTEFPATAATAPVASFLASGLGRRARSTRCAARASPPACTPGGLHRGSMPPWTMGRRSAHTTVPRDRNDVADRIFEAAVKRNAEGIDGQFFRRDRHAQKAGVVLITVFQIELKLGILLRARGDRCPRVIAVGVLLQLVREPVCICISAAAQNSIAPAAQPQIDGDQ